MRRIGAVAVALTLATPATAFASLGPSKSGPSKNEVEKLYVEGQDRAEAKDYTGAADSWTRLLNILPESPDNQAIRESVMINVLEAHMNAFNLLVDQAGKKDISHLRKGKATLDEYYGNFKTVHGDRVAISPAVQSKAAELDAMLAKAEDDAEAKPDPDPKTTENGDPRPKTGDADPKVVVLEAQNNGNGLIIGGSIALALGVGALVMIPVGVGRVNKSEKAFTEAEEGLQMDPGNAELINKRDKAEFDGKQGQQIWIAGAVLSPLLLAGGVVMIVFGVRAKQKYNSQHARMPSLTPALGRNYAGFQLRGRF
jgi:hypothetical protein